MPFRYDLFTALLGTSKYLRNQAETIPPKNRDPGHKYPPERLPGEHSRNSGDGCSPNLRKTEYSFFLTVGNPREGDNS